MNTLAPSSLLRTALVLDALGSGPVALLQLAGGAALAERTGIPQDVLYGTGLFLVGYVALLLVLATRRRLPAALVRFVIVGNVGWALAALAVEFGAGWPLTSYGVALIGVHVVAVLAFALLQYRGLRQSVANGGGAHAVPAT